jgi:HD-GYP domain-containing protein (c-di-GMP phosphodiesterase class II)
MEKRKAQTPKSQETSPHAILKSFTELQQLLNDGDWFNDWLIEHEQDFIGIRRETVCLLLIPDTLTQTLQNQISALIPQEHSNQYGLIVVHTSAETHGAIEPEATPARLQHRLTLPLTVSQIKTQLENLLTLHAELAFAEESNRKSIETSEHVKNVLRISRQLNGIRNSDKLLSLILRKAREVTNADAGSIYIVDWPHDDNFENGDIVFKITQNETVDQDLSEFRIAINEASIVGNAVVNEATINIPDLYELDPDPAKNPWHATHDKTWDQKTGYQCRSMLTLPIFDISHRVIGVIQLINCRRPDVKDLKAADAFSRLVVPFDEAAVEYAEIVAQQAGIALENAFLTEEKEQLFEGFVHASVTAIEQRDPTTSGHSHRVAALTLEIARLLDSLDEGRFRSITFNKNQLKEIEYASLLHDFGKLGVREQVLTKAKKLYPWEMELLIERFEHIRSRFEVEYLQQLIAYHERKRQFPPGFGPESLQQSYRKRLEELDTYFSFITKANEPTVLEQGGFERLKDIANLTFADSKGHERSFLQGRELEALSVSRGSLTREEFAEIQSHVEHTYEFLRKIPWGRAFSNVPEIAAKHHEKLDGSGYPTSSHGNEIPVQTRIMTIADIFDALTASDRPYKKAVPIERALDILNMEVNAGKLDKELYQLFVESRIYEKVTPIHRPPGKS